MIIKFSDIKPTGNFDFLLNKLEEFTSECIAECDKEKKYDSCLAKGIKMIVNEFAVIEVLEEGIEEKDTWSIDEAYLCLLYAHLLVIRLNDCAQKYLNNITPDSEIKQLNEYIQSKQHSKVYKNLQVI